MPEDAKKHQQKKSKIDPKDQRKPRQRNRDNAAAPEKHIERKVEPPKGSSSVPVPQKPPIYEEPGPEFYKNLKRETDEILKITEEENTKYKKKEIQSNWAKYEVPIESYEEIEEQENMGADYEKLINAPIGGHFQFKYEKSWDISTGPSLYDKYFDINMESLAIALFTIPFYERNNIEDKIFNETDILNMKNRATKYKQKYYNDKSYTTPELETQEKILYNLKEHLIKPKETIDDNIDELKEDETAPTEQENNVKKEINIEKKKLDIKLEENDTKVETLSPVVSKEQDIKIEKINNQAETIDSVKPEIKNILEPIKIEKPLLEFNININEAIDDFDDIILGNVPDSKSNIIPKKSETDLGKTPAVMECKVESKSKDIDSKVKESKNPIIESPEDLEKWLDDFLDG